MKIALAQMKVSFEDKASNRESCKSFLLNAKENKADLIIFPEMTLTGFSMNAELIGEDNNESINWFKEQALNNNLYIGLGHVKKQDNKNYNCFSIISPHGKEICSYAKIHPFSYSSENTHYEGGKEIVYTQIGSFKLSPFICYDLRFPEIFQIASTEAQLITVAANWPKSRREAWITLLKARAIENQCFVAGVNVIGTTNGLEYSGDSMVIDPKGKIIAEAEAQEGLVMAEIDIEEVNGFRAHFPVKNDRKEELYKTVKLKRLK